MLARAGLGAWWMAISMTSAPHRIGLPLWSELCPLSLHLLLVKQNALSLLVHITPACLEKSCQGTPTSIFTYDCHKLVVLACKDFQVTFSATPVLRIKHQPDFVRVFQGWQEKACILLAPCGPVLCDVLSPLPIDDNIFNRCFDCSHGFITEQSFGKCIDSTSLACLFLPQWGGLRQFPLFPPGRLRRVFAAPRPPDKVSAHPSCPRAYFSSWSRER